MKVRQLPAGYHVENFSALLGAVMNQYSDLLNKEENELFDGFQALNNAAQSLYVRLLTRKGPAIRIDKLHYADILDLDAAIHGLLDAGMALLNADLDSASLLAMLTKPELIHCFQLSGSGQANKTDLLQSIAAQFSAEDIRTRAQSAFPHITPCYQSAFEVYKMCFFGNSRQDLSEFVITDLGHVQYEAYSLEKSTRYFSNREQIHQQMAYAKARQHLQETATLNDASRLLDIAHNLPPPDQHPHLSRRYQNVLLTIARQLERLDQAESALQLYKRCDRHPSRERQARILKKLGQLQLAWDQCVNIENHGHHPEELEFAQKFKPGIAKRLGKTITRPTSPWQEKKLSVTPQKQSVEILTASELSDENHQCYYVENTLFCSLFGLLFWDIIFSPISGAFTNPFQRGPQDMHSEFFYPTRKAAIDARMQFLQSDRWQHQIKEHFMQKQGMANPFVFWGEISLELLEFSFTHIPAQHIKSVLQRMLEHPGLYRNGFPDLIRFSKHGYELIEVKAPGDKVQPNQARWLRFFCQANIPAHVLWVSWHEG